MKGEGSEKAFQGVIWCETCGWYFVNYAVTKEQVEIKVVVKKDLLTIEMEGKESKFATAA